MKLLTDEFLELLLENTDKVPEKTEKLEKKHGDREAA